MKTITILIVHAHKLIGEAWMQVLNNDERFKVLAQCDDLEMAMEVAKKTGPGIILLDSNIAGIKKVEPIYLLHYVSPGSRVIAVSHQSSADYARKMVKLGAQGYVTKNATTKELIEAILAVEAGEKFLCRFIRKSLADELIDDSKKETGKLSPRELEVVELIRSGNSSREIAAMLSLSVKTVEVHRYNIMKKLRVKNVAELIDYIYRK